MITFGGTGGYRVVRGRVVETTTYPLIGQGTGSAPAEPRLAPSSAALSTSGSWALGALADRNPAPSGGGMAPLGWYALAIVALVLAARS